MQTIMLIDDDPTMLRLLTTLIEIEGFKTEAWSGSANIIEEITTIKPDAVLLDVNLQGLNGIEVLKKIRANTVLQSTPVLMSSGMDYSEECMKAGATDFILKPYMPDALIKIIRSHTRRKV
jgi:DNA-binding response OmpR family regulator